MKKKRILRWIALMSAAAITAQALPLTAVAAPKEEGRGETVERMEEPQAPEEGEHPSAEIVSEEERLREPNVKHYRLRDGTMMAATYPMPVHFQDEEGRWQEYDNTLIDTGAEDDEEGELTVRKSDQDIRLSKKAKKSKMITVSSAKGSLSWGYMDAGKSVLELTKQKELTEEAGSVQTEEERVEKANNRKLMQSKTAQEGWYRELYRGVDLQVLVTSLGVKENLILKQAGTRTSFDVAYKTEGLTAEQTDRQTVTLRDEKGEAVYTLSAPMMTDGAGESSTGVTLTLLSQKNKKLTVRIAAEESWLKEEGRVYPVTVDPFVLTKQSVKDVDNTSLVSKNVSSGAFPYGSLYVGWSQSYGDLSSVVKINNLPQLRTGDMVTNAKLYLLQGLSGYNGISDVQVNVSRITSSWTQSGLQSGSVINHSNKKPSRENRIEDYVVANQSTNPTENSRDPMTKWDVTRTVKGWYSGETNNGLMLWSDCGDSWVKYASADSNVSYEKNCWPCIVISYVNNNGLEDYWTYHSQEVGADGSAHINDYTGNLVVTQNILSTTGALMPVNVSLVYNSNLYQSQTPYGLAVGQGWRFDFDRRIDEPSQELKDKGYKYRYTDADGTEHYFRAKEGSSTEWVDEEGLGLTLTESSSGVSITDKGGYVSNFYYPSAGGLLSTYVDPEGNYIEYINQELSTGGRAITTLRDGAGRNTTVYYDSTAIGGRCRASYLVGPDGYRVNFRYPDSAPTLLTGIEYPDGTTSRFIHTGESRLETVETRDRSRVSYAYTKEGRVDRVVEYAIPSGSTSYWEGASLDITYNADNTTTYRDNKGRTETVQFDYAGRTMSVVGDDGSIANVSYHRDDQGSGTKAGSETRSNNKRSSASSSEKFVNNFLKDSSAEKGNGWYPFDSSCTIDTTVGYLGTKSLRIRNGSYANSFYSQSLRLTGNRQVTLSAYAKTENLNATAIQGGASLHIAWYNGSTLVGQKVMSYGLKGSHDWTRLSLQANLPSGVDNVNVYLDYNGATGTVWFDCVQLENGPSANNYNLLEDPEIDRRDVWSCANMSAGDAYQSGQIHLKGQSGVNKYVSQFVEVNRSDVCFNIYGMAKGDSVPVDRENRSFSIELSIAYEDGQGEWHNKSFNPCTIDYQSVSLNVKPTRSGVKVRSVGLYFIYRNNANEVDFYKAMVNVDVTGTSYTYDKEGNLISAADNGKRKQAYTYSGANELTKGTTPKNDTYSYTYNGAGGHRLTAARSDKSGTGFVYSYDDKGNVTWTRMGLVYENGSLNTGVDFIGTSTDYLPSKNYVAYETDARGLRTHYDVDESNGLVKKITAPWGKGGSTSTTYAYNSGNYLTGRVSKTVGSQTLSNHYGYDGMNRLTSIYHNGFNYNFGYDHWGNRTTTKIQDRLLASNTYEPNNGPLSRTTYGNGDYFGYGHDEYDRITWRDGETGAVSQRYYTNQGQVSRLQDYQSGQDTDYVYDLEGRLVGSQSTGNRRVSGWYEYDVMNNQTLQTNETSGGTHAYGVGYGLDNRVEKSYQGLFTRSYSYDGLQRNTSEYLYVDGKSTPVNSIGYGYTPGAAGGTTTLVKSIEYYQNDGVFQGSLEYTYDDGGNIATIQENGNLKATYTYDELGQLIREDNAWANRSYLYHYDDGGNLTLWQECNYKTGALSRLDLLRNNNYTYGDSQWKDLLTSYNGTSIGYDAIGNPSNWRDGMTMTWTNGRRLSALQKGNTQVSYTYGEDGLRTRKTVKGSDTWYDRDAKGKVVHQEWNGHHLYYYYDGGGNISTFSYDLTRYAYRKNAQGDVTAITDTSGNIVARYGYDAWGRVLYVTDGSGNAVTDPNHVANANPIRYRSYFYDEETGFYYLNSRYYDPTVGRFVNSDGEIGVNGNFNGLNLFAYCNNNPVIFDDPTGEYSQLDMMMADIRGYHKKPYMEKEDYPQKSTIILGTWYTLKNGYTARKDPPHYDGDQKHMHVYKDGKEVANQNADGKARHDGKSKPGEPVQKVKDQLKDKAHWDWDANAMVVELPSKDEFLKMYPFFVTPAPTPGEAPSFSVSPYAFGFRGCPA